MNASVYQALIAAACVAIILVAILYAIDTL
jgi:hypothetical protein